MTLSETQFDALAAYIEAAIDLAVAKADYHQEEHSYDSCGYLSEDMRLHKAREAAQAALVRDSTP